MPNIVTLIHAYIDDELIVVPRLPVEVYGGFRLGDDLMKLLEEEYGVEPYDAQDMGHQAVCHDWLEKSWFKWQYVRKQRGILEHTTRNDCDNRAFNFWQWNCELFAQDSSLESQAPSMGIIKHLNPGHVINWVETDRGFECFDAAIGFVSKPDHIYKVMF